MKHYKRPVRPRSVREAQIASQAGLDFYASMTGKDRIQFAPLPAKRKRAPIVAGPPKEHFEQVAYVQWFRRTYPGVLIFAIPNGGNRDGIVGWQLKQEGVTPDVPDLLCPKFMLFVEMKRIGGRARPGQKLMAEYLIGCGFGPGYVIH